jgi:hypothetical protein
MLAATKQNNELWSRGRRGASPIGVHMRSGRGGCCELHCYSGHSLATCPHRPPCPLSRRPHGCLLLCLDVPLPYAFLLFIEEFCTLLLGSKDMSTLLLASSTARLLTAAVQPSRPTKVVPEANARNGGNGASVHLANSGNYITRGVLAYSA